MKEPIILLGAGGHCKSVIDVIESEGKFNIFGILDKTENIGKELFGYKIIGVDSDINDLIKIVKNYHITVGHIKSNIVRVNLYNTIKAQNGILPKIISPKAYVSKYAIIGEGTIVMHNVFINANASIGINTILNTGSIIEHDVVVKNHCHISTGAIINGECIIESNSFVGSNSIINQCISIAENNVIASGSTVNKSTLPNSMYAGSPAWLIKK